ncbi:hypothetical protein SAMN04489724_0689 [Algoriphagus locisalis]|uniref:Histidine kinase n=2 Tax=Algoriphagus locisalis TaxID=305507 RepID=A0A1I6XVD1_9BACT|nr:hypothetical protein SAMN04489724_0689 [Algoriphagus locisalis]
MYDPVLWTNLLLGLTKRKHLFIILLLWSFNFTYDYVTTDFETDVIPDMRLPWVHFFLGTPFILFLFYRLFPAFRGIGHFGLTILQLIGIVASILFCTHLLHLLWGLDPILNDSRQMMSVHFRLTRFTGFALIVWLFSEFLLRTNKINQVNGKLALIKISHDHLTLSPHLILNMLNNIAGKSSVYSDELYQDVEALAVLLKESYKDPMIPRSVYEEVGIVSHMLKCVRGHKTKFFFYLNIRYTLPLEYYTIPHLVLATLVENMLKFGQYTDRDNPCEITVSLTTDPKQHIYLVCSTFNLINPVKNALSSGHGLPTIANILNHFHGPDTFFELHETMDEFSTLMIIPYGKLEDRID